MRKSANTKKTDKKRKPPRTAWKPGQSGNPAGRPKDGESWTSIISEVGNAYPEDILAFIGSDNDLGKSVALLPKSVQNKYLVVVRVFAALMFEPTSGLLKELLDRLEGKVTDRLDMTTKGDKINDIETVYSRVMARVSERLESGKPEGAKENSEGNEPG